MGVTRVEVEIQELVLHGFREADGAAVAEALDRALRSQLASAGADWGRSRTLDRFETPAIHLAAGASPRTLGTAVARRLHGSLRP
jgi:hypothetical protein